MSTGTATEGKRLSSTRSSATSKGDAADTI